MPPPGMVGKEVEAGTIDCRFPNVRKTYWRSATWSSHSAPPSPRLQPFSLESHGDTASSTEANAVPSTPRAQESIQSNRQRAPLPPLQPLSIVRKSLDEWPSAGLDDVGGDWPIPATPGGRKIKTGLDIKLDLASIQRTAVEPTEIQLKRDKFAHFDKQCSRVANYHIYLGSDAVARDRETLRANGITHVLNCVGFVCPEYFKQELNYKTLWLQDSPCEDITSLLYDVFDYFEDVREQGGRVFVHCCQGVSRSTSLVIAYLMWRERSSFEDAFQDVKTARGVTNPNMGFACQLLQCQKRVHATPMSPNSVLRMYRLTPHSPYDPLHLVPKAVTTPGAGSLDSRGAFVIQLPNRILVWIGHHCDPKIAQSAKEAAGQVVRYERAEGLVQIAPEGREGPEFWQFLSKYSVSQVESIGSEAGREMEMNTEVRRSASQIEVERVMLLGVGNRKVPSYDGDYDLFRIARQGGVIPPVPFSGVGMGTVPTRIPLREDGWSVLRRKFLSGKLVTATSMEKPKMVVSSPDTSVSSTSAHLSPGSIISSSSSSSSSATRADPDSPFGSPVSHFSDLSPDTPYSPSTPFATPVAQLQSSSPSTPQTPSTPFATPVAQLLSLSPTSVSHLRRSPPDAMTSGTKLFGSNPSHPYHPYISTLQVPSFVRTSSTHSANKCSPSLLAQRRGSVAPSLHVPGLEDDPPPAPRGMSRKPKLPPLVTTTEKCRAELPFRDAETSTHMSDATGVGGEAPVLEKQWLALSADESMEHSEKGAADTELLRDLQIESTSAGGESHTASLKSIEENGCACLYRWPGLERMVMFHKGVLDTTAAFVLVVTHPCSPAEGQERGAKVFVWVGRQLAMDRGHETNNGGKGLQAGLECLAEMQLPNDVPIRVVNEGEEPNEFWEAFNQGLTCR